MGSEGNIYDQYADQYAELVAKQDEGDISPLIASCLFKYIGDVHGLTVLDAGCGEGYIARILAGRGAKVTGIDVSPRLVEIARSKEPKGIIDYQVYDLSKPFPEYEDHFDLAVCNLVLNDVLDYVGFVSTLGAETNPT